jgi:hypothetical protein
MLENFPETIAAVALAPDAFGGQRASGVCPGYPVTVHDAYK